MSKRVSILVSLILLVGFGIAALVTGRPPVPLFDELPAARASGVVAYESGSCIRIADLQTAKTYEVRCSESGRSEFRFNFTDAGQLQIGTWEEDAADLIDPSSGAVVGQTDFSEPTPSRAPDREFPRWNLTGHTDGKTLTVDDSEYLMPEAPSGYQVLNASISDSGTWVALGDNLGQLVIVGEDGGPWVVDTGLNGWGRITWSPAS